MKQINNNISIESRYLHTAVLGIIIIILLKKKFPYIFKYKVIY